jgi:hypothetical protein
VQRAEERAKREGIGDAHRGEQQACPELRIPNDERDRGRDEMEEDVLATRKRERVVLADEKRGIAVVKERRDDRDVLGQIREGQMLRGKERQHRRQRDDPETAPFAQGVEP